MATLASDQSADPEASRSGGARLRCRELLAGKPQTPGSGPEPQRLVLESACLLSQRPVTLGSDLLRRSVIYSPSEGHQHLRPGFRNHRHSPLCGAKTLYRTDPFVDEAIDAKDRTEVLRIFDRYGWVPERDKVPLLSSRQ